MNEDKWKAEIEDLRQRNADQERRIARTRAIVAQGLAESPKSEKLQQAWEALKNGPSLEEHRGRRR